MPALKIIRVNETLHRKMKAQGAAINMTLQEFTEKVLDRHAFDPKTIKAVSPTPAKKK